MRYSEIMHGIKCNRCQEIYRDEEDCNLSVDVGDMEESAVESGWFVDGDKHYCPNCYAADVNNVFNVRPAIPKEVFKVKAVVETMLGHRCLCLTETTENYKLTSRWGYAKATYPINPGLVAAIKELIPNLSVVEQSAGRFCINIPK